MEQLVKGSGFGILGDSIVGVWAPSSVGYSRRADRQSGDGDDWRGRTDFRPT